MSFGAFSESIKWVQDFSHLRNLRGRSLVGLARCVCMSADSPPPQPPPRLAFSAALPVLLSRDIDKLCAESFLETARNVLDTLTLTLASPRSRSYLFSQRAQPEWDLAASLLFYGVSMARYGATPGMQFCGISMVGERIVPIGDRGAHVAVYSRVRRFTLLGLALLYSLEPYMLSRGEEISSYLQHLANLIAEPEAIGSGEAMTSLSSLAHDSTTAGVVAEAVESGVGRLSSLQQSLWAYSLRVGGALVSAVHSHWPTPAATLHGLLTLTSDLSLFHFYRDGRFANVALRLTGVRLYNEETDGSTARKGKLRALSLLLLIKYGLYSISFLRVFVAELMRQRQGGSRAGRSDDPGSDERGDNVDNDDSGLIERLDGTNASMRQCVLCMGRLSGPAAAPCGHVYCWSCVMEMCRVQKAQGRKAACAICRRKFNVQSVRALYSYC